MAQSRDQSSASVSPNFHGRYPIQSSHVPPHRHRPLCARMHAQFDFCVVVDFKERTHRWSVTLDYRPPPRRQGNGISGMAVAPRVDPTLLV